MSFCLLDQLHLSQSKATTNNGEIQAMSIMSPTQKVLEVTEINLAILESFPPRLQISVFGTVTSTGWSNPQLVPYTYVQAPPDGIYDFDFMAEPPKGVAAKVISPIRFRTELPAEGIKGIRVHASLNFKEAILHFVVEATVKLTEENRELSDEQSKLIVGGLSRYELSDEHLKSVAEARASIIHIIGFEN